MASIYPAPYVPSADLSNQVAREVANFATFIERNARKVDKLPEEMRQRIAHVITYSRRNFNTIARQRNFLQYVKHMWPKFIEGSHHAPLAQAYQDIADGKLQRLMIFAPPRSTKSEFSSVYFPTWYLGRYPDRKVMQFSNKSKLALKFGGSVKQKMDSKEYREVFKHVWLSKDAKSKEAFETDQGGRYVAMGVSGKAAGEGGDVIIIDDPHSEQDIKTGIRGGKDRWETYWEWFNGIRQRLQPSGSIILCSTRWHKSDIAGRCLREMEMGRETWRVINVPAIITDPDTGAERS